MASLRDVLDHAGTKVRILEASGATREGLGIRRGPTALVEARLEPRRGERILFVETGESFEIAESVAEAFKERVDHYRLTLAPAAGSGQGSPPQRSRP